MADSRLALILEANDQASAILQKVRNEIEATGATAATASGRLAGTSAGISAIGDGESHVLKTTRALGSLSYAAEAAQLGSKHAVFAIGEIAEGAALAVPALAAWAIPIAAAVTLLGVFAATMDDTKRKAEMLSLFNDSLNNKSLADLRSIKAGLESMRNNNLTIITKDQISLLDRAQGIVDGLMGNAAGFAVAFRDAPTSKEMDQQNDELDALKKKLDPMELQEKVRLVTLQMQTSEMSKQKAAANEAIRLQTAQSKGRATQLQVDVQSAKMQRATEDAAVEATFRRLDPQGQIIALTAQERAEEGRLLGLDRDRYNLAVDQAKQKEIERAKDARFQANTQLAVSRAQASGTSNPDIQNLQAQIAYQKTLVDIQRAGYAPELAKYLEDVALQAFDAAKAITALQVAMVNAQLKSEIDQNSGDPMEQYRGRMEAIMAERDAAIKSGASRVLVEQRTQQQIRSLQRDTINQAKQNYASLEDVLVASKSREVHGVGEAMRSVRKVILGYEAAEATVNALKYGAKAIGYAADQKWGQAAMAAAAALQFAKVAAVAGQESLGGGSTSSGGGGSTTQAQSFEPRTGSQGNGGVVVNLITRDPYGRDSIQTAMYEINRAGTLGVPAIAIPPTTGVRRTA